MKMVRVKNDDGQQQLYSKAQLAQLDKDQGRIRLNAHQHQSVIYLLLARYLLEEAMGPLEPFLRLIGGWRRLRIVAPMLRNLAQLCADHMSHNQLISIADNLGRVAVTISAEPITTPEGGCLNVRYNAIDAICGQALHACDFCAKTREESKTCEVRRAFDAIPALKLAARQSDMGAEACPYVGLEVPEDAEG